MRVSLSVDPGLKTMSETATLEYVRKHTSIPVPKVIASSSTSDNELGFEYILLERVQGQSLDVVWPTLDWDRKVRLVGEIASIMTEMQQLRFDRIGSLFNPSALAEREGQHTAAASVQDSPVIDRLVFMAFFWKTRYLLEVPREPLQSTRDWLDVRFRLAEDNVKQVPNDDATDGDDRDEMEKVQQLLARWRKHMDRFFPLESEPEVFSLFYDDISSKNLIVNTDG